MLDGMSDSIQGSRIENLHSREVDRQSPTGLILLLYYYYQNPHKHSLEHNSLAHPHARLCLSAPDISFYCRDRVGVCALDW